MSDSPISGEVDSGAVLRIVQGNCLDVLRGLDAESVDLIFADPPFNVGIGYAGAFVDRQPANDYYNWCESWVGECFRVLKPTGTFYLMTITRHLGSIYPMMHARGVFINQVNWRNVASVNGGRCFWNEYQPILVYGKSTHYKFYHLAQTRKTLLPWSRSGAINMRGQLLDHWDDIPYIYGGSIRHAEAVMQPGTNSKAHPAQMPVALATRAIVFSTDRGDLVLDPFNGSGTTGVACWRTGRRYLGIEIAGEYVELSRQRLASEMLQPALLPPDQQESESAYQVGLFDDDGDGASAAGETG